MKKIASILIMGMLVMSGCSYSTTNSSTFMPNAKTTVEQEVKTVSFQAENNKASSDFIKEDHSIVFWSHKEISNLKRLDEFMESIARNKEDRVTIETVSKEGEPIVKDLTYEGKRLLVSHNSVTKEYEKIFVEERFNEHYNGNFIEYFVKDETGKRMLVLQIGPNSINKSE